MKRQYCAALIVITLAFFLPFSAHAEIRAGSTEVGIFGGYTLFEDSQNLKNRPVLGGRIGYNFTSHFGLEGAFERIQSHVDSKSRTGAKEGQFRSPMDEVELSFFHINAVYHLIPEGRFNPFVLVGVGGAHYSPEISDGIMTAFNVGLGTKLWLSDNFALRVDIKDTIVSEVIHHAYHNVAATIGMTVAFGGAEKPVPARAKTVAAKPVEPVEPVEPVVILVSEPKAEEKVAVIAAEPVVVDKVVVLAFEDIHFNFDKATLTPQAQAILKRNLQILQQNPHAKIRIAGFTSASGTEEYNQKLSERRATAVKDFLVQEGVVTPDRLTKIGYGETRSATYEAAPKKFYSAAAKANMRVLFELIVKDQ